MSNAHDAQPSCRRGGPRNIGAGDALFEGRFVDLRADDFDHAPSIPEHFVEIRKTAQGLDENFRLEVVGWQSITHTSIRG